MQSDHAILINPEGELIRFGIMSTETFRLNTPGKGFVVWATTDCFTLHCCLFKSRYNLGIRGDPERLEINTSLLFQAMRHPWSRTGSRINSCLNISAIIDQIEQELDWTQH